MFTKRIIISREFSYLTKKNAIDIHIGDVASKTKPTSIFNKLSNV